MKRILILLAAWSTTILLPSLAIGQTNGIITTFAGNYCDTGSRSWGCFNGDGAQATATSFAGVACITQDRKGNFYVGDLGNRRVRKIDTAGIVTTIAGNGTFGYSGDGGPATAAELSLPSDLCFDKAGNLYISDFTNGCVRKVDTAGIITTYARVALGHRITGIAIDQNNGSLYMADFDGPVIQRQDTNGTPHDIVAGKYGSWGYSGDTWPATDESLSNPMYIVLDKLGNLYIADDGNGRVRKVTPWGTIGTFAGGGGTVADGGPATWSLLDRPAGLAIDDSGNVYIGEETGERIRKVNRSGIISTIAGTGAEGYAGDEGPATAATFRIPQGICVDPYGRLYVADLFNHAVRKIILPMKEGVGDQTCPSFTIFPNPSAGRFTVRLSERASYQVSICDAIGQRIYSAILSAKETEIDIGAFPKGTYFMHLCSEGKRRTENVIIK